MAVTYTLEEYDKGVAFPAMVLDLPGESLTVEV
jgi:hypothetical protein